MSKFEQPEIPAESQLLGPVEEIEINAQEREIKRLELETGSYPATDYLFAKPKEKEALDKYLEEFLKLSPEEQKKKLEKLEGMKIELEEMEKRVGAQGTAYDYFLAKKKNCLKKNHKLIKTPLEKGAFLF